MWYVSYAALATVGTWLLTALGASTVFFFSKTNRRLLSSLLGFSAGIMLAASYFSLLAPALEASESFVPVTLGFLSGGAFLIACDLWFSRRHAKRESRVFLLISSITLHNIPEGLAVGVAFGALRGTAPAAAALAAPVAVAVGIGLQNFPEGAAVSLPLRQEGHSRFKSFMMGQLSGIVEPVAGVSGALLVTFVSQILPFALAFAAGAMVLVCAKELIPQAQEENGILPALMCLLGFALMMLMDVALS